MSEKGVAPMCEKCGQPLALVIISHDPVDGNTEGPYCLNPECPAKKTDYSEQRDPLAFGV